MGVEGEGEGERERARGRERVSCDIHTHTPAKRSSTDFRLYPYLLHERSTNSPGHGHGYECHIPERAVAPAQEHGNGVGRNGVGKYSRTLSVAHRRPSKFHLRLQLRGCERARGRDVTFVPIPIPLPKRVLQPSDCTHIFHKQSLQTVLGMGMGMNITSERGL